MDFPALERNLARVRAEISEVQSKHGLVDPVTIVAVTKGHPPSAILAAAACGLRDIGENRVQEAMHKWEELGETEVRWHLVGHLQTNKARFVPGKFHLVHSVDSNRVAAALSKAVRLRKDDDGSSERVSVLLQVNVAEEEQKYGCQPEDAEDMAHAIAVSPELKLIGVMAMAPFTADETVQRRVFASVKKLRDKIEGGGLELPTLSMGMSGDYRAAVAEGANMVRLGTVLFGERQNA
ncbi:MAG: YggS family pyridoxal phosphate-dependent enzyme [Gemmatimonadales bacterium]